MADLIPVFQTQSGDFEQIIDLEGVSITIRLIWNIRVEYWFVDVSTPLTNITGIKLVQDYLLLDQYKASLYDIPGDFVVRKLSDEIESPTLTYDNFGIFWGLFYLSSDEVGVFKNEQEII